MKVVVSGYIGKRITGIGRNLISLLNNSSSSIEYIVYANYDMQMDMCFKNTNVSVKKYNVSKSNSMANLLWTTFIFPWVVKKEKGDVALIPNFTLLLFKMRPTVVMIHDLIEFNVKNKFSPLKMFYRTRIADPITARKADRIITVSQNSKKDIVKFLNIPHQKISVVYNGVDRSTFNKMEKEKALSIIKRREWPERFILFVGTIDHPGKNAMSVVKAFEMMKRRKDYLGHLILAGMPGKGYRDVKEYIDSSEYSDYIVCTGFVFDEELIALYSLCDTFVFVSLYEGFGIPPLEAMSCGARVVVSNTSSLPEVVGSWGETVDPLDCDAITKAILKSIQMDDLYVKNKHEFDSFLRKFDWHLLNLSFEKVLNEVV